MAASQGSFKDTLLVGLPALALIAGAFALAYQFVDPAPPERVVLAAGSPAGAYHRYAMAYREILARDGVDVEILESAGSVENLARLTDADDQVEVAFVQGGIGGGDPADGLVSLASLYFEPVWVFHRRDDAIGRLTDLAGQRVAIGPEGSGTRAIALTLLGANGIDDRSATLVPLAGDAAADALLAGGIDAMLSVSAADAAPVRRLLESPSAHLMSFDRADAYARRHRFLSPVVLPEGMVDLARNHPPADTRLVAPAATLVAREDLHPALIDLLMAAAAETHRDGGLFEDYGRFPSPEFLDYPLSEEARRFFESGPSFLRRVLPYWAATLVERTLVLLLPLIALTIPLIRIMPPVYRWRIRSRIYRWYRELLSIDPGVQGERDPDVVRSGLRELERIEDEVAKVEVPMSYADQLYHLRMHIELVRTRLSEELTGELTEAG